MTNNAQITAAGLMLCTHNTGAWRVDKKNLAESRKVNAVHGTDDAATVRVKLTKNPHLLKIYSLHNEAYIWHTANTLPSVQDNMRVLPAKNQFKHSKAMGDFYTRHCELLNLFMADYPDIRLNAPFKLNGLFDGKVWPADEIVRSKFKFQTRYLPCPHDGAWAEWLNETAQAVQSELRERLIKTARHLAEVLKNDGKLFQSAFDNLNHVCELAGDGFNVLNDPIIAQAARELRPHAMQSAETFRDANTVRQDTAGKVADILKTLKLT